MINKEETPKKTVQEMEQPVPNLDLNPEKIDTNLYEERPRGREYISSRYNLPEKQLTVLLPQGLTLKTFDADVASASVLVGGTVGGKVSETGTSSNYKMEASSPDQIEQTQKAVFDPVTRFLAEHGVYVADGRLDKVFTARRNGKLLILNDSGAEITREFTRADGTKSSLTVPDISILEA